MDTIFYDKIQHFRPIEAPSSVLFEPVTIGWYLLASFVASMLALLLWRSVVRYRRKKYRRDSIRTLRTSYGQYSKGKVSLQEFVLDANTEMKRVAIRTYGRENVAGLSGSEWSEFIRTKHRRRLFSDANIEVLHRAPFDSTYSVDRKEVKVLQRKVTKWIGGHHA